MSAIPFIDQQLFIERIVGTLNNDVTLFPDEATGQNLVNDVLANQPAVMQSPDSTLVPYIAVFSSGRPLKWLEKAGRDGRNEEGGSVYEYEFYCVLVTDVSLSQETAQQDASVITAAMMNTLSKNLRLSAPTTGVDPLCRTTMRYMIPYILKGDVPVTMKAINVVVRPQVYISPRSV